ncbi:ATP-binding protein [Klebsiella oxytoca]|uniref:AAA family ATPase n=1 Tax=Klebsiella oxytoca TaxID=571 RepID=UPI0018C5C712|nr:AAA family ATPase [Klebsiella oxytoca]MBG2657270.1 ATP-binding protein [Klebsiella oxytoca]
MANLIKRINQLVGDVKRNIRLDGKNLIIVGNNGAGKTIFLKTLDLHLKEIFMHQSVELISDIQVNLKNHYDSLKNFKVDSQDYNNFMNSIGYLEDIIEKKKKFDILFDSTTNVIQSIKKQQLILRFFKAGREYVSANINLLTSVESLYDRFKSSNANNQNTSDYFESYLVSMSNYALLEKGAGEIDEYNRVTNIINQIQSDLRDLFEDENLVLNFNRKKLRMEIVQKHKNPFGLDELPSGFASILAVYSELIMLSELSKQDKDEVKGIVLIDEIDAHLHVTLQKKVFNFFTNSFPNVQFIISTHSPFVVQSVSNAIIYNLSNNEQMEDLSIYSYSSIVNGLLGETTNSDDLEALLLEVDELSKNKNFGDRYKEVMNILESKVGVLDPRAKAIYLGAKSRLVDWREEQGNV